MLARRDRDKASILNKLHHLLAEPRECSPPGFRHRVLFDARKCSTMQLKRDCFNRIFEVLRTGKDLPPRSTTSDCRQTEMSVASKGHTENSAFILHRLLLRAKACTDATLHLLHGHHKTIAHNSRSERSLGNCMARHSEIRLGMCVRVR